MNVSDAKTLSGNKQIARQSAKSALYPTILKYLATLARYMVLLLFALLCLVPMFWVISSSLKVPREIAADPLGFPPTFRLSNYVEAWTAGRFGKYFLNSVIVSLPIVIGSLLLASLAGYGLARFKFRGANSVFYTFLVGLMVPFQSVMIPLFYILKEIGFLGTYLAMIVPSIALGLPFGIFFMRAFFAGLPNELADAAEIDGCNEWDVFWQIMVPLAGPAISTLAVLTFMGAWNAFLLPLIYMQKESLRPLVIGLMFFRDAYTQNVPLTMAGATIVMLPIMVVYLMFQRKFVQGLTAGALK
jgi:raffinose/stachyose/melibiose transport system permease protein